MQIAGADEAGRGPLVGSVVAAAVILDPNNPIQGLNDSKKLTEKNERNSSLKFRKKHWLGQLQKQVPLKLMKSIFYKLHYLRCAVQWRSWQCNLTMSWLMVIKSHKA